MTAKVSAHLLLVNPYVASQHNPARRGRVSASPLRASLLAPHEIDEGRRQLPFLSVPIGEGGVDVGMVVGHDLMVFGVRHQPMLRLAGNARMHRVGARRDAG